MFDAFNRPRKGKSSEGYRADQMPAFINANNLQPFIDEQFIEWTKLIDYIDTRGIRRQGYNARVLRGLCKVYIDAFNAGVLQKSQLRFVPISQSILYTLSDIGIIALVDEATGFDKAKERAKNQLQQFLNQFLREEAAKWVKVGCLLQINKGSPFGSYGRRAAAAAAELLEKKLVYCVGSDAHSPYRRTPYMGEIRELLSQEYSSATARRLLDENPRQLLGL